jgi:aminobenzoyl-glutamate utilization protein B
VKGFFVVTTRLYELVDQAVEQTTPIIQCIANEVWEFSELSLQEIKSAQLIIDILQEQGFKIISKGTAGVPTAFIAEYSNGTPTLGFLVEYDALPGLGNEPVPYREPRKDQVTSGHGCGHNLLGAGCIGAAIVLKNVLAEQKIPGTICVYGCAAEESEGAKVYMARAGLFKDLDAALHWHPSSSAEVSNYRSAAIDQLKIEFFGKGAHAGGTPWLGRSAVHAAELFAHGINLMREHVEPTSRLHYIYESAGLAPNVVPDYARICLYVRDCDRVHVEATTAWVKQIAEGAALATQTTAKVLVYTGIYDLLPNTPLAERMQANLENLGAPTFIREEQAFAREIQRNFGVEQEGMALETMPMGVSVHTWAATACHGMSIGLKGAHQAARVLAWTGFDIMTDAELRQAAYADFERRVRERPYVSPLPPEMKHPLELPEWLTEDALKV